MQCSELQLWHQRDIRELSTSRKSALFMLICFLYQKCSHPQVSRHRVVCFSSVRCDLMEKTNTTRRCSSGQREAEQHSAVCQQASVFLWYSHASLMQLANYANMALVVSDHVIWKLRWSTLWKQHSILRSYFLQYWPLSHFIYWFWFRLLYL